MAQRRTKQANGQGERPKQNKARHRWEARYSVTIDEKRVQRLVTGRTAEEVRDRLRLATDARDSGLMPDRDFATVADFIAYWRAEVLPGEGLAPSTEQWYGHMLDAYVIPGVGSRAFTPARGRRVLSVGDVESMTAKLGAAGLSTRVQGGARIVLSKVLHAAQQRDLVTRNVARLAKPPRDRGRERVVKALTPSQTAAVLAAVDGTTWHPIALLSVSTGLRPGELLALHWGDVHLDKHEAQLSVRRSLSHVGGATLKAPKRERSYRVVPIAPEVVPALRSWRRAQTEQRLAAGPAWSDEWPDLVFTTPDGRPQRVDTYRIALGRAVAAANEAALAEWTERGSHGPKPTALPHVHPHMLRHTYATHLIEAGVPIAHVAELLGDTVAIVESTYSHVLRPKHEVTSVLRSLIGAV
jgi:integrase